MTARQAKTWDDTINLVTEIHIAEGAAPSPKLYRTLGNQALSIISNATGLLAGTTWSGASLTITGNTCALPVDLISIESVEWNGEKLERTEEIMMDEYESGWRTSAGTPSRWMATPTQLILDCIPSGTGLLIRGMAELPEFPVTAEDANPLASLPIQYQLLPAYYILGELPARSRIGAAGVAPDNTELQRQTKYSQMWLEGLTALRDACNDRRHPDFR